MKSRLKRAFTLLEILISIMLLTLVLMALYRSADILRQSNKNLFKHLQHSSNIIKGANTLYMDLLESDGHISISNKNKEFYRLTIDNTKHSLYGLYKAKVIWLVYKEDNTLLRLEGIDYKLPLKHDDNIAIDKITTNIEIFTAYKNKKKNRLLVVIKSLKGDPLSFMVQNLEVKVIEDKIPKVSIVGGTTSSKKKDPNMLN